MTNVMTQLGATAPKPLATPTDLDTQGTQEITEGLNHLVSTSFALYVKTKNFHWHLSGTHFRDYHLLLDEQADAIFATIDPLAERVRKIGGTTIRSIGHIGRQQLVVDNDENFVAPLDMLRELMEDNKKMAHSLREVHETCDKHKDVATASLLEVYIDETERRTWFLFETIQKTEQD